MVKLERGRFPNLRAYGRDGAGKMKSLRFLVFQCLDLAQDFAEVGFRAREGGTQ